MQGEFDLDGGDGVDGVGFADGGGVDFAEADAADFALLHVVGDGGDGFFEGDLGVEAGGFEDVDGFFGGGGEDGEAFVDAAADVGAGAVEGKGDVGDAGAFDRDDDAGGGGRVGGQVAGEEVEGVGVGRAVEFTAVPEGGVGGEGGVKSGKCLVVGNWGGAPGEVCVGG